MQDTDSPNPDQVTAAFDDYLEAPESSKLVSLRSFTAEFSNKPVLKAALIGWIAEAPSRAVRGKRKQLVAEVLCISIWPIERWLHLRRSGKFPLPG